MTHIHKTYIQTFFPLFINLYMSAVKKTDVILTELGYLLFVFMR